MFINYVIDLSTKNSIKTAVHILTKITNIDRWKWKEKNFFTYLTVEILNFL